MKLRVFLFLAIVSLTMSQHVFAGDDGDKAVFEQISVQEVSAQIEAYNQGELSFSKLLKLFKKIIDAKQFDVLETHIKALDIQKFKADRYSDEYALKEQIIFFYDFVVRELPRLEASKAMNVLYLKSWQCPMFAYFAGKVGVKKLKLNIGEDLRFSWDLKVLLEACKATLVELDMREITVRFPEYVVEELRVLKDAPLLEKVRLLWGVHENILLLSELLPTWQKLKSFDIHGSFINCEGNGKGDLKPLLEALQTLPHLETLSIGDNEFNSAAHFGECMQIIARMPSLTTLDLSEMGLYRYECVCGNLPQMPFIKQLSLRKNFFAIDTDYDRNSMYRFSKGPKFLGEFLAHFPNIAKLDVWDSSFPDQFVLDLARLHLANFNRHLTHVNFGYYAYRHLGEESQFERNQFSDVTKASLADALLNAKVYF